MEQNRYGQMSLFAAPREKGSGEWAAFGGLREDRGGMYRVVQPADKHRFAYTVFKRPARPQALFVPRTQN